MNERFTYTYEFIDTRFDTSSTLAEDSNQCYGEDVAKHLYHLFSKNYKNTEIIEEDWGCSIAFDIEDDNTDNKASGAIILCIYPWGFLDNLKGDKAHLWRIRIVFKRFQKMLGFIKYNKQALPSSNLAKGISSKITPSIQQFIGMHKGLIWR